MTRPVINVIILDIYLPPVSIFISNLLNLFFIENEFMILSIILVFNSSRTPSVFTGVSCQLIAQIPTGLICDIFQ